ncbi:MAG: 1,4-alpha-glucan branching protein domain-containing protein [Segniliparus sp.]|uniref:1,4-alpha-glucan branching protein domain-containing protein n=1 Tax=Segniliparus sp. TaxID=2804064 RepID=UPI003F37EC02
MTPRSAPSNSVPGMFSFVLHTHLPWVVNHGRWPVGEEWLYQAWAQSYLPLFSLLRRLGETGRTNLLSLSLTPVLAAQLDDPLALTGMRHWLANWALRADEAAVVQSTGARPGTASSPEALRRLGAYEHRQASAALAEFESSWLHGGSPVLRQLVDTNVVELLGGPLAHSFSPLLNPRMREFTLREGLADAQARGLGRPRGIWAPECAFTPGMGDEYARAGVERFLLDGPAMHGETAAGRPVEGTDVLAFGRDLSVTYRVWSPKSGYPGDGAYRDFHTYDHLVGLKPARVTGHHVPDAEKAPYDPARAQVAVRRDVADFVQTVRERLVAESARTGRPALVVAAFDTELFGHWWHEGPEWLEQVLTALPEAGVRVGTLAEAASDGFVGERLDPGDCSWGSGKDWRVWAGPQVADLVELNADVVDTALRSVDKRLAQPQLFRDRVSDQILREALLTVSSDWAFLVSKDTAAQYARGRAHLHAHATREIAEAAESGHEAKAVRLAAGWQIADSLFGRLDARRLGPR